MTNVLENEYIVNQFAVDLVVLHSAGSCHRAMKLQYIQMAQLFTGTKIYPSMAANNHFLLISFLKISELLIFHLEKKNMHSYLL